MLFKGRNQIPFDSFKKIKGYNNYYANKEGLIYNCKTGRFLGGSFDKDGYIIIHLRENGRTNKCRRARLIAETFLENPDNLPQVNHKDEIKSNDSVNNLEWCSNKYNSNYGTAQERKNLKIKKPIIQKTLDGDFIKLWDSGAEIERTLGIDQGNISMGVKLKRPRYGFIWEFAVKDENKYDSI